jgi:hypothetical protein
MFAKDLLSYWHLQSMGREGIGSTRFFFFLKNIGRDGNVQ